MGTLTQGLLQAANARPATITVHRSRCRLGTGAWLSAQESRMVLRGQAAGYREGRHERPAVCPYPDDGRPRRLWLAGWNNGRHKGVDDRAEVLASYQQGLDDLEHGTPNPWRHDT